MNLELFQIQEKLNKFTKCRICFSQMKNRFIQKHTTICKKIVHLNNDLETIYTELEKEYNELDRYKEFQIMKFLKIIHENEEKVYIKANSGNYIRRISSLNQSFHYKAQRNYFIKE